MLFKYADDLHSAMLSGKGKDIPGRTLSDLIAEGRQVPAAADTLRLDLEMQPQVCEALQH
jgi:hypothetical protein